MTLASTSVATSEVSKYKGRILFIDSDVDKAQAFSLALQKDGFIVDTYTDPLTAIANFIADLYDLVLTGVGLPNMDGFDFHNQIRNLDRRIKVCFMSRHQINYLALREQGLKVDCFISKPAEVRDLVNKINAELG